jgi:hypothetical protein
MSTVHLTTEEIDLVLIGDGLPPERAAHLAGCVACRRRLDDLGAAIAGAREAEPDELALVRARRAALTAQVRRRSHLRRWLAAAAVLVLVTLVAVFVVPALRPHRTTVDTDAVLLDVDRVLARDPLTAMADESVVDVVVAGSTETAKPSAS